MFLILHGVFPQFASGLSFINCVRVCIVLLIRDCKISFANEPTRRIQKAKSVTEEEDGVERRGVGEDFRRVSETHGSTFDKKEESGKVRPSLSRSTACAEAEHAFRSRVSGSRIEISRTLSLRRAPSRMLATQMELKNLSPNSRSINRALTLCLYFSPSLFLSLFNLL